MIFVYLYAVTFKKKMSMIKMVTYNGKVLNLSDIEVTWIDNHGNLMKGDIKEAYVDGAEYMLQRVLTFMRNFQNGSGEFPLYDYISNVRKAMEE